MKKTNGTSHLYIKKYSIIQELKILYFFEVNIIRNKIEHNDDILVGGFEILALQPYSQEEKEEFIDTLEKLIIFSKNHV